jgi:DNA polymerase elongation subunit (family B)
MLPPRVCLFDIETAPSLGYFWGKLWETNIIGVESPWYMLCFSYKWLGKSKIYTHSLREYPGYNRDRENDKRLIKDLWKIFDEADVLIGHNGDRFDIRKTYARFIKHDMKPPAPCKTIDTLKAARRYFQFESNRLNDLGQYLGVGKKLANTGFDLWKRTMEGEDKAWEMMERYNRRDIVLLEKVYLKLRPYMANHPNLELYAEKAGCPACQSNNVIRQGSRIAMNRRYQRFQCCDCGFWFRGAHIPRHEAAHAL